MRASLRERPTPSTASFRKRIGTSPCKSESTKGLIEFQELVESIVAPPATRSITAKRTPYRVHE